MKKNTVLTGVLFAAAMVLGLSLQNVAAAESSVAPQDTIKIEGKRPVKFKHSVHLDMGVACGECHHAADHKTLAEADIAAMGDTTVLKCATCHNKTFQNEKLQKRKTIFHTNCKDCHKKGFGDKKGPTKCSSCHGKKKRKKVEGC